MSDYYADLGLSREASPEQIKKAFREKAFKFHPDRNADNPSAEEKFKKINEAYSVLGDAGKKARYDMGGYSTESFAQGGFTQGGFASGGPRPNGWTGTDDNPFGQYSWTYYGPFAQGGTFNGRGREETITRQQAFELLLRSLLTGLVGVLLIRLAYYVLGFLGVIICITAIGRGLMNSLRAIALLINLKK